MLVTSTGEVLTPRAADVMFVLLNQAECFVDFALGKTDVLGKLDGGLKPKLGFTALALNVHMHSRFFAREEVETEAPFAKNCWTHGEDDTRNACSGKRRQTLGLFLSPVDLPKFHSTRLPDLAVAGRERQLAGTRA